MTRRVAPIIVHVNQHVIKHNAKHGTKYPALTVKHPKLGTAYCHEVRGTGNVVDANARGRKPLSCGARVWIEYDREGFTFCDFPIDFPTLKLRMQAEAETHVKARNEKAALSLLDTMQALQPQACPVSS